MWSVAGWELRVFIPVECPPTAQEEREGGEDAVLDVFRWAKRHKKDLKAKWKEEEEKRKKKDKKKDKKGKKDKKKDKNKEEKIQEDGDEQKKGKKGSKKKQGGGPIERRTDFYLHIAPSRPSRATRQLAVSEEEDGVAALASPTDYDDDEAALGRWVEEGCGLKLRGGPWGHQLELKVRTASAEADAAGDDPLLHAERWVKLALPRVGSSDEVVALPPRTVADLVVLHRAIAAAVVADDGDNAGGTWLGGGWRGLVRAAGEFVRHHLSSSSSSQHEEEVARERAQVAVARQAIGRRLMIAAGVAGGNTASPDHRHHEVEPEPEPREPNALDGDSPASTSNEPSASASASLADAERVEAEAEAAAEEALLCGVWQVDKARRQRNVKWPVARPKEKKTAAEEAADEEEDGGGVEVLVVEQTDISTFTYRANAAQGDEGVVGDERHEELSAEQRGDFVSVCVEGGSPEVLRHFMAAFLSSLPPSRWRPVVVGYPGWVAGLAHHQHPQGPATTHTGQAS